MHIKIDIIFIWLCFLSFPFENCKNILHIHIENMIKKIIK